MVTGIDVGLGLGLFATGDYMETSYGGPVPGPAPVLTPPMTANAFTNYLFEGTPRGTLDDDSQPAQDDAGGAPQLLAMAE